MSSVLRCLTPIALAFAVASSGSAAVLHVPSDHPTIAAALDVAVSGDSVLVAAGTYSAEVSRSFDFTNPAESVVLMAGGFLSPGVSLVSEEGPDVTTISVSGGENFHCLVAAQEPGTAPSRIAGFRFERPPGATAILAREMNDGWTLTIENCVFADLDGEVQAGAFWSVNGGNARVADCSISNVRGGSPFTSRASVGTETTPSANERSMEIERCDFTNGAGIEARFGLKTLRVLDCTFDGNGSLTGVRSFARRTTIEDCSFDRCVGDPVYIVRTGLAFATVRRCEFRDCTTPSPGNGAIRTLYLFSVAIEDCRFERCSGQAGAVHVQGTPDGSADYASITNCVFVDIDADRFGALYCDTVQGEAAGNTFVNCSNANQETPGAAMRIRPPELPIQLMNVHHNIFEGSSGSPAVVVRSGGSLLESCNCYWDNAAGDASGFTPDATSFGQDPQFCDAAAGEFTIRSSSPCAPPGATGCGLVGALPVGCGPISIGASSWAAIKSRYR